MHAHRFIPTLLILLLIPLAHAAACSMNATISLTNTHPAGYVYARLPSLPGVNLSITPHRAYTQQDEQATFTLTITAEASRSGSVSIPFYTSGVLLKRVTLPYTLTCPGEAVTNQTGSLPARGGWQYERGLLLILFLLVWLLLLPALAVWWKRRWIRREVLRILELQRRKPMPRWIIWLLMILILTGFILLIIILAQPGISLITSMLPA